MENKLITLFKQCCDNKDFEKNHHSVTFPYNDCNKNFPFEDQPFKTSKDINAMLIKCGYSVKETGGHYKSSSYGRQFEFDGEPPLRLIAATVDLTLLMGEKHITLGPVHKDYWIEKKEEYKRSNFWRESRYITVDVKHEFLKRSVEIDYTIIKRNQEQWKANQTEKSFSFCPRSAHRYEQPTCFIASRNFEERKASNFWFNKQKVDIIQSAHFDSDMADDAKVMSGLRHDHMKVNGGLLTFGDVWLWLDWEDYQEMEKYYLDSIKRTHEAILEKRLNETKG